MSIHKVLNQITSLATQADYEGEVSDAREQYFANVGAINEDDQTFEPRMALFLEWYLFNRDLKNPSLLEKIPEPANADEEAQESKADVHFASGQKNWISYFVHNPPESFDDEENELLKSLLTYKHSIFEFSKSKDHIVWVTSFNEKKKIQVYERRGTSGFMKGSIFEARLLQHDGHYYFSGPMLFHPQGAKKFIKKIYKEEDNEENVIFKLSAMALKCERYRHVPQEKIYCFDETKLGSK